MKTQRSNSTFEAIERILSFFPKIASILFGGTALAYLVSWLYAKEYFSVFGATWILNELSTHTLLSYSWRSVVVLLFLCYLATLDLEESDKTEGWMLAVVNQGKLIIVIFLILQIIFESLKLRTTYIITSHLFVWVMTFYATASFGLLVIELKNPSFKWNLRTTYLTYSILLVGLYLAPTNLGRAIGYSDVNQNSLSLPIVKLKGNDDEYRLLYQRNDTFFVFSPDTTDSYPNILVADKKEIDFIKKKKRNQNMPKRPPVHTQVTGEDSTNVIVE